MPSMSNRRLSSRRFFVCVVACTSLALGVLASPPAQAAPEDILDAAATASLAAATGGGIDVIQLVTFTRSSNLIKALQPPVDATVPAGAKVRVHLTANPDGQYYQSIRRVPSAALLGASGRTTAPAGGLWATFSVMTGMDYQRVARDRGLTRTTAVTSMQTGRMGFPDSASNDPMYAALSLLLPPYWSESADWWRGTTVEAGLGGRTIIRAPVIVPNGESEDTCTRKSAAVIVGSNGRIESSVWTQNCPGIGLTRHSTTVVYGPQTIKPPTTPRKTMNTVMAMRIRGADSDWQGIVGAANRMMVRPDSRLSAHELINSDFDYAIDVDASMADPVSGQSAFSEASGADLLGGWHPSYGWWATVQQMRLQPTVNFALAQVGLLGAASVVNTTARYVDNYGGLRWNPVLPGGTDMISGVKARVLAELDQVILAGEPGNVAKEKLPGGTSYRITPRGRPYVVKLAGMKVSSIRVLVNAAGAIVGVTMNYTGLSRTSTASPDARVRTAPDPAAQYEQIAPFLP
jgi:hypothetical protein